MSFEFKSQTVNPDQCDVAAALKQQAQERPAQVAFRHHGERGDEAVVTYAELDRRARAIAGRLQSLKVSGDPVLLAYPAGPDFVAGLFGCLYAGCIAVPTSLPYRRQRRRRFQSVVRNAAPTVALTTEAGLASLDSGNNGHVGSVDSMSVGMQWLATDRLDNQWSERWVAHAADPQAVAMLQYTSGSTSEPRGVALSHRNLLHNAQAIYREFTFGSGKPNSAGTAVFWLPTYHDMGLIGGIIVPVYGAVPIVSMSPAAFLRNPLVWLEAISRHKAAVSGGPNFAYDLCVRKISDEARAKLDLSSWRLAFVGAEPVHAGTLERFAERFGPCGFRAGSFYPCYGLAEATLMVSGAERGEGPWTHTDPASGVRRVSCGRPVEGTRVAIVDPQKRVEVSEGKVGEIWVSGPSVGQGYWRDAGRTARMFRADLSPGPAVARTYHREVRSGMAKEGPFLRTGDLGFMHNGELFITGRRDDVMIIRGVNHYPQDIEATARGSHPLLEAQGGAAFSVSRPDSNRYVLLHEVTRNGKQDLGAVIDAVSSAVLQEHDLALDAVVLVRGNTLPRTSSGKIRRQTCRDAYLAGDLYILDERGTGIRESPKRDEAAKPSPQERGHSTTAIGTVCEQARILSRQNLSEVTAQTPVNALGLDSLQRVELLTTLEKRFGRRLPHACEYRSVGELADAVQAHLIDGLPTTDGAKRSAEILCEVPPGLLQRGTDETSQFPELAELDRHERMLRETIGENPYFRIDEGGAAKPGHVRVEGRDLVNFCGYDYLGMSQDPEVAAAVKAAVDRYGTSACASRLVSGEKQVHSDLEQSLARFLGTDDAMVFVSGHATNVTVLGHLFGSGDLIVHDVLAHNSLIEGARLSGAQRLAFAHQDWKALDSILTDIRHRYRRVLIAVEGVYGMDGDWPDLPRFISIKKKHAALLLVDEAHSLGTMGATGRGIGEHCDISRGDVDIWMGTLSKALASCGGFIAGSRTLVKYLKHTAPGFVYSVGLSPPDAAAALASLSLLEREPQRVHQLRERAGAFLNMVRRGGLDPGLACGSPVISVMVNNSADSLRLSRSLFERGINVHPILSPAVPENEARLRFFITINHTNDQIRTAVDAVSEEFNRLKNDRAVQQC